MWYRASEIFMALVRVGQGICGTGQVKILLYLPEGQAAQKVNVEPCSIHVRS